MYVGSRNGAKDDVQVAVAADCALVPGDETSKPRTEGKGEETVDLTGDNVGSATRQS